MRKSTKYLLLFIILIFFTIFVITNKDLIIREHLTAGPPTLATLQADTQDLQTQITQLNNTVTQMTQQAQAQSSQAMAAKAQITAAKSS